MDNILIYSRTRGEHIQHVNIVKKKLEEQGLKLNEKKCEYYKESVKILGHVISKEGIKADESRIQTIKDLPLPSGKKLLMSLLGLFNYCYKFVKDSYKHVASLYDIIKLRDKNEREFWDNCKSNDTYIKDVEMLKKVLKESIILGLPDF